MKAKDEKDEQTKLARQLESQNKRKEMLKEKRMQLDNIQKSIESHEVEIKKCENGSK
jgi:hypothetical protein